MFAFRNRGVAWVATNAYDKAIRDFEEANRLDPTDAYSLIYGHFAARRAKDEKAAQRFLTEAAAKIDETAWPHSVLQFLRGKLDEQAFLKAASDDDDRTEAHCYLGIVDVLKGRKQEAITHFRWVNEHGSTTYMEYFLAIAELKRLEEASTKKE